MERYETVKKLATGSYGVVYSCRDKQCEKGTIMAVKVFLEANNHPQILKSAVREAALLELCIGNPHIVQITQAYRSESGKAYIVLEYLPRVLSSVIMEQRELGGMPRDFVWGLLKQLLQAVRSLHKLKIIHRDLKPANLMLTNNDVLKVIDLGLARQCHPHQEPLTEYVQTRWYRAPELLVNATYGYEVDIWAVGCIAVEMVTGLPLFPGKSHIDQLQLVLKCFGTLQRRFMTTCQTLSAEGKLLIPMDAKGLSNKLKGISPGLLSFITACLQPDPLKRPTAEELLKWPQFLGGEPLQVAVQNKVSHPAAIAHAVPVDSTPGSNGVRLNSNNISAGSDGSLPCLTLPHQKPQPDSHRSVDTVPRQSAGFTLKNPGTPESRLRRTSLPCGNAPTSLPCRIATSSIVGARAMLQIGQKSDSPYQETLLDSSRSSWVCTPPGAPLPGADRLFRRDRDGRQSKPGTAVMNGPCSSSNLSAFILSDTPNMEAAEPRGSSGLQSTASASQGSMQDTQATQSLPLMMLSRKSAELPSLGDALRLCRDGCFSLNGDQLPPGKQLPGASQLVRHASQPIQGTMRTVPSLAAAPMLGRGNARFAWTSSRLAPDRALIDLPRKLSTEVKTVSTSVAARGPRSKMSLDLCRMAKQQQGRG